MNKEIKIILGATEGDEGKTILSRYLCLKSYNPISIIAAIDDSCYSHNIDREKNFNYADCVFGGGSLEGYPTFFPQYVKIHPGLLEVNARYFEKFMKEMPVFYIEPLCYIETPIDFLMRYYLGNEDFEKIGKREDSNFAYTLKNFLELNTETLLKNIYYNFYKERLQKNNINSCFNNIDFENLNVLAFRNGPCENQLFYSIFCFKKSIEYIKDHFICANLEDIYNKYDTLIFEGAKGITANSDMKKTTFTQINSFINSNLKEKNFNGECCYVVNNLTVNNYNDIYEKCEQDFNIGDKNPNFKTLSFGFTNANKEILKYHNLFNNIYYFNTKYSEDGIKIFYQGKKNNKELTTAIIPHNHNSGLPYCLNVTNKEEYKGIPTLNKIAIYPYREDYPYKDYTGSNIESICDSGTYELHIGFIQTDFGNTPFLLLLDDQYLIDQQLLKDYYITYIGFKNFIVKSFTQAKKIKEINPNLTVYLIYDKKEDIDTIKLYIDGIIINWEDEINFSCENLKLGIIMPIYKMNDVYFKWNNNCDFFLLKYDKKNSFMNDICDNIITEFYRIKDAYDDFFGE